MKKLIIFQLILCSSWFCLGQQIPFGQSQETFVYYQDQDQTIFVNLIIGYYKPANYDSLNSEIILYCHGMGGDQNEGYNLLNQISDKRKALIVSPTSGTAPWGIAGIISSGFEIWLPDVFKKMYKHILQRENRNSINVRLIGFSAGGQCVTRYMLIRQGINDSIPIKMAVSINPYFYTFPTDSLDSLHYSYPWGIAQHPLYYMGSVCDEHIKGYFNENYTVLIGTADTVNLNDTWSVMLAQGTNRYERAVNFYNFSEQDAIDRGTSLQWYYAEVPDVGHNGYAMINTKASPTDTVTICEHYLFDMPYHEPQKYPPTADFDYSINDTTQCVEFNADCKCWWQIQPTTYTWDFGNGITASGQNINVNLPENGMYNVQLTATNIYGSNSIEKTVEITSFPQAGFLISDTIVYTPDAQVSFNNQTIGAVTYLWDFGDSTQSSIISPTHTYQNTGLYTVSLISSNIHNCCDTLIKEKAIEVKNPDNINYHEKHSGTLHIFPNPATNNTTFVFKTEKNEHISLKLYNYTEQYIKELFSEDCKAGTKYIVDLNTKKLAQGVYFAVLQTRERKFIRKLVVIR